MLKLYALVMNLVAIQVFVIIQEYVVAMRDTLEIKRDAMKVIIVLQILNCINMIYCNTDRLLDSCL